MALFPALPQGPAVASDASGNWGCGAFAHDSLEWFQISWPPAWQPINIAVKELFPVVVAAAVWGRLWGGLCVHFHSDNQAVVAALNSRTTRDPQLMHLLRCLFFFEAHFRFEHQAHHLPGKMNKLADALSRDRVSNFRSLSPQAARLPTPTPMSLVDLLSDLALTWTSQRWKALFRTTLREVWPAPLIEHTMQQRGVTSPSATTSTPHPSHSPSTQLAYLPPSLHTKALGLSQ